MNTEPKFWQGTNFWIALILAVGGLFVGFPEGEARAIVAGLFGLVAAAGAFREKLKGVTVVPSYSALQPCSITLSGATGQNRQQANDPPKLA